MIFRHTVNFLNCVLLVAAIVSIIVAVSLVRILLNNVVQEYIDAVVIGIIVVLNTIIGVSQEFKSEKTLEKLKQIASPTCSVIRNTQQIDISAEELVPGDIVLLTEVPPLK